MTELLGSEEITGWLTQDRYA